MTSRVIPPPMPPRRAIKQDADDGEVAVVVGPPREQGTVQRRWCVAAIRSIGGEVDRSSSKPPTETPPANRQARRSHVLLPASGQSGGHSRPAVDADAAESWLLHRWPFDPRIRSAYGVEAGGNDPFQSPALLGSSFERKLRVSKTFQGVINIDDRDSIPDWEPYVQPVAPAGSPNVLYIVLDDVGFSAMEPWGGRDRDASTSSNWRRTASPTPTGTRRRFAHRLDRRCSMAATTPRTGWPASPRRRPGSPTRMATSPSSAPPSPRCWGSAAGTPTCSASGGCCPSDEMNLASTKRNWPVGRGFERFYGFLGGETNQWYPDLSTTITRWSSRRSPTTAITSRSISPTRRSSSSRTPRPSLPTSPSSCTSPRGDPRPHHAPKEWIDKYEGKFDMGYEAYRQLVFERPEGDGRHPPGCGALPAQPLHRGDQRRRQALEPGRCRPTLGFLVGRREAAVPPHGGGVCRLPQPHRPRDRSPARPSSRSRASWRTPSSVWCRTTAPAAKAGQRIGQREQVLQRHPRLGRGEPPVPRPLRLDRHLQPLPAGWAWAFNTPFKMWKRYNFEGGVADPMVISWPAGITAQGELRHQFCHATDIVSTVYDCLGVKLPGRGQGPPSGPPRRSQPPVHVRQRPTPHAKETGFFSMLGSRAIWHKGWKAVSVHPTISGWGHFDQDRWELTTPSTTAPR